MRVRRVNATIDAIRAPGRFTICYPRRVAEDSISDLIQEVKAGDWLIVEGGRIKVLDEKSFLDQYEVVTG